MQCFVIWPVIHLGVDASSLSHHYWSKMKLLVKCSLQYICMKQIMILVFEKSFVRIFLQLDILHSSFLGVVLIWT